MERPPSILLIIVEHTGQMSIGPHSPCQTPHLDRLSERGVRFERCYTTNPICSPARASLMTGLYPSAHGMWDCAHTQRKEWLDVPAGRFTHFASLLRDAGWRTAYFGKWHVEQTGRLEDFGWSEYDCSVQHCRLEATDSRKIVVKTDGYRDFLLAGIDRSSRAPRHPAFDAGISFLRRTSSAGEPFFCVVSTVEPHDPYIAPAEYVSRYDIRRFPLPASLRDACADKPEVVRRMQKVFADLTDDDWRFLRACYCGTLSFIDGEVGRILACLEETGRLDDTLVIFTSDHGDMLGGHGLATKGVGTPYEEVLNIPMIVAGPGVRKGVEETASLVSILDLGPTILDLCRLAPLSSAHGRSFRQILEGRHNPDQWQDAYAEFFGQRFMYTQRIVWHRNWKYVFSPGGIDELYDLSEDPHERRNLASDPAHREPLLSMCGRMWKKMKQIGDMSLFNSHYAVLRTAPAGPLAAEEESDR